MEVKISAKGQYFNALLMKSKRLSRNSDIPLSDLDEQDSPMSPTPPKSKIEIGADGLPVEVFEENDITDQNSLSKSTENNDEREDLEKPDNPEYEEDTSELDKKTYPNGPLVTLVNLLNSLLGAGILGVPNSFINLGIFPSFVLLVMMCVLSEIGTIITIHLQHALHAEGFPDLAFRLFGRPGAIILAILSLFFLMGCQLSYLVLGSDMIISFFAIGGIDMTTMWRRAALVLVYACIPITLSIPKNKPYLKYISTSTAVFILFFDVAMVAKGSIYFQKHHGINPTVSYGRIDIKVFSSLSIYALAVSLPCVVLPVISQYNPSLPKRYSITSITILVCFILVFIPGIFGYLMFGDDTKPNITQSFPDKDILIILVRAAFILVVSFAYVSISQNTVISWSEIIFKDSNANLLRPWKRSICLIVTNIIPLLIAMFLANAKPALNIGGAMGGCMTNFFFPGIMWFKNSDKKWYFWKNILCILLAIFGLVSAVISTYQAVLDAIDAFSNLK